MKSKHFLGKLISAYKEIFSITLTSDFLSRRRVCFRNMFFLRPLLYGVAELSWASQLFIHSQLQNEANRLREKQKVSSARGNSLAGSHFRDCRVIILAGPTFIHINTLARPTESSRSGPSGHARAV